MDSCAKAGGGPALAQAPSVALEIDGITKSYGKVRALEQVTLAVKAGEFLTLLGPSGSGKTTLLMTLAGFVRPDAGRILLDGQDIVRLPAHRRGIGMMFQNYALFPHMSVGENVAYPLRLRGMSAAERARRVGAALAMVQLDAYQERRIDALSGGQRQRVALARATVFEPRILLMDEPLSALDKKLREQMQLELRRLHQALGMTTICVTHDQREALTMSDRVAVMKAGGIVQVGAPDDLYRRPANAFVADFIGESALVPVQIDAGRVMVGGQPLVLREPPRSARPHALVVRPEQLRRVDLDPAQADAAALNIFIGTVLHRVYEGESVVVHLEVAGASLLRMRMLLRNAGTEAAPPEVGARIAVALHRDDAILVEL